MQRTETDHEHLARAIELAERGVGSVSPNPVVGAVVVRDDRVVGEGWHERVRRPARRGQRDRVRGRRRPAGRHALRVAGAVLPPRPARRPAPTRSSPPASARVVVAATTRPRRPPAAGLGILRDEGVAGRRRGRRAGRTGAPAEPGLPQARPHRAPVGALQVGDEPRRQGRDPHRRLEVDLQRGQPRSSRTAGAPRATPWRSGSAPRWPTTRSSPRASTACATSRGASSSTPPARLPLDSKLVSAAHEVPLIVVVSRAARRSTTDALENAGAEVIVATGENEPARVRSALDQLGALDPPVTSVLLEGGPHLAGAFLDAGEIDELRLFIAPLLLGGAHGARPARGRGRRARSPTRCAR